MKKKIKKTLSIQQQRLLARIALLVLVIAIFWLVVAPDMGIFSLIKQKDTIQALEKQRLELETENAALRLEMERIHNDIDYFEHLARQKGLLKENEIIFDFSKEDGDKKE